MNKPLGKHSMRRASPAAGSTPAPAPWPPATALSSAALVHELEVHQRELEMQNEELRRTQLELAAARDVYMDLYDFAPVGYFTLDRQGLITGVNLTGAALLGEERTSLLGRPFARSIAPADAQRWQRHLLGARQSDSRQIELDLQRHSGEPFHGQLDCMQVASPGAPPSVRVTLTDITQHKLSETHQRIAGSAVDAHEAERRRVALELHEDLGQRLSALKMELASFDATADPQARKGRVAAMLDTLDGAVATVRRIVTDLRPLMLDELGLHAAIDWLARDTARRSGLKVNLHLGPDNPPLDERASVAMYRMAQEALAHMTRHTRSRVVNIQLEQRAGALMLSVQGHSAEQHSASAFDADSDATLALRDGAHMLGGKLEFDASPAHGPRITMRLPLASRAGPKHPTRPAP